LTRPSLAGQYGRTFHQFPADVKVIEGRYNATGASTLSGRYVNTIVKKGGAWKLATVVTIPDPAAAPKKERGSARMLVGLPLSDAGVAQLVEQLIRNQQVIGSSPIAGSSFPETIRDLSPVTSSR
jgi:hypothetical protein